VSAFASKLLALDRSTGAIVWKTPLDVGTQEVEIAVGGGLVVAATHTKLAFVEYASGKLVKVVERAGEYRGRATMLIDGPHIYVGGSGEVACYSQAGDLLWLQPFTGEGFGSMALGLPGNVRQADDVGSK
jgi:outer membrane protein assembly factor BamB